MDRTNILHILGMDDWMRLEPQEGRLRAESALRHARKKQDAAQSDTGYWAYDTGIAVYSALYALYYRLERGQVMFTPPGKRGGMLMDANADLVGWASQLLADHHHAFTRCRHWEKAGGNKIPGPADHPKCGLETKFMTTHWVCDRCGEDRHAEVVIR